MNIDQETRNRFEAISGLAADILIAIINNGSISFSSDYNKSAIKDCYRLAIDFFEEKDRRAVELQKQYEGKEVVLEVL